MSWRWVARRRTRGERGAAAVEFGLLTPVLILLVFGVIEFGMMLNRDMLVSSIARDGARTASLGGTFASTCSTIKTELASTGIPVPATCVTTDGTAAAGTTLIVIDCKKADGSACNATVASFDTLSVSGATATIKVSYGYTWITPVISTVLGSSTTLTQRTQMVVE